MFIYYYIIDGILSFLNFTANNISGEIKYMIIISIIAYIFAFVTLRKFNDYLG
jgi:hypothetical protein